MTSDFAPTRGPAAVLAGLLAALITAWVGSKVAPTSAETGPKPDRPPSYVVETVAGSGEQGTSLDGKVLPEGTYEGIAGLALAPDGAMYILERSIALGRDSTRVRVFRDGVFGPLPGPGLPEMGVSAIALDGDFLYVSGTRYPNPPGGPLLLRYDLRSGSAVDLFKDSCPPDKWPGSCPQAPWVHLAVVDHSILFSTGNQKRVYAIDPDGSVFHFAVRDIDLPGFGRGRNDGGAAQAAFFVGLSHMAAQPEGNSLLMVDGAECRVRLVDGTGIIRTVAGSDGPPNPYGGFDSCRFDGDGGPAVEAGLDIPSSAVFGARNDVMIAEQYRIRRVGADGRIHTVAGVGESNAGCGLEIDCCSNEPTPALEAPLGGPFLFAIDATRSVYFTDGSCPGPRLRVLRPVEGQRE